MKRPAKPKARTNAASQPKAPTPGTAPLDRSWGFKRKTGTTHPATLVDVGGELMILARPGMSVMALKGRDGMHESGVIQSITPDGVFVKFDDGGEVLGVPFNEITVYCAGADTAAMQKSIEPEVPAEITAINGLLAQAYARLLTLPLAKRWQPDRDEALADIHRIARDLSALWSNVSFRSGVNSEGGEA